MYDLVKLRKCLTSNELKRITEKRAFDVSYNENGSPKEYRYKNKFYIRIYSKGVFWIMTFEVSLHKYFYYVTDNQYVNYKPFSFENALFAAKELETDIGVNLSQAVVKYYELGLNIMTDNEPKEYIKQMVKVGKLDKTLIDNSFNYTFEKLTENGRYKRTFYKVYDKTHEVKECLQINIPFTLRFELVRQRPENKLFSDLLNPDLCAKDCKEFETAFCNIEFEPILKTFGLTSAQKEFLKEFYSLSFDPKAIQDKIKADYKIGALTEKQRRTKREFFAKWENGEFYGKYDFVISDQSKECIRLLINALNKNCPKGQPP